MRFASQLSVSFGKRSAMLPSSATSVRKAAYSKGALVVPLPRHASTHWCQWLTRLPSGTGTCANFSAGKSFGAT